MKRGLAKNKTGQFYLIAAIIISVIVIGLVTFSNYTRAQEPTNIQSIGDELKIESEKILDFGLYNRYSETQRGDLMEDFITNYITYEENEENFYFFFGDRNKITFTGYSQSDTTLYINVGAEKTAMNLSKKEIISQDFNPQSDTVVLSIDETDYEFELKNGENFYFVVNQEIEGEKHVVRN